MLPARKFEREVSIMSNMMFFICPSFVIRSKTADSADQEYGDDTYDADVVVTTVHDDHSSSVCFHHIQHGLSETNCIEGAIHRVGDDKDDGD